MQPDCNPVVDLSVATRALLAASRAKFGPCWLFYERTPHDAPYICVAIARAGIRLSVEPADDGGSSRDWVVVDRMGGMVLSTGRTPSEAMMRAVGAILPLDQGGRFARWLAATRLTAYRRFMVRST